MTGEVYGQKQRVENRKSGPPLPTVIGGTRWRTRIPQRGVMGVETFIKEIS